MKQPLVSIVIPTHNRKMMLFRLLDSLLRNTYKEIEVIIVDDASSDNTYEEIKKRYKRNKKINIFRNKENLFSAGSKNVGLDLAKGEFIAFIDDDNVVDKKLIEELVFTLINNPQFGEVGPMNYSYKNKNKLIFCWSDRSMWTTKTYHHKTFKSSREKYWETDDMPNAFMVRRDILRKYKIKFSAKFGIMYEESIFAYKIKEAGYKIYMVKNAKIYHDIEDESGKRNYLSHFLMDPRRSFTFARNRMIFHSKFSSPIQKIGIYLFWVWVFTAYYTYKLLFYKSDGEFSLNQKVKSVYNYFLGNLKGYQLIISNEKLI